MENASKALIMAGSVLIAILVISILVYGYNQLSGLEQTEVNSEDEKKLSEYMRQFEQFNRTLYGSEILSLANLQADYNESDAREGSGYDEVQITVQITTAIDNRYNYFTVGNHDISDLVQDKNNIEAEIDKYSESKRTYNNRSVKYYSGKSYREIALDFGMNPPSNMASYDIESVYLRGNATTSQLLDEIQEYTNLTSIYTEFRTGKQFNCTDVDYSNQNGRITKMVFTEI